MAPELLGFGNRKFKDVSEFQAADMWALGEIAFRMLTGKPTSSQWELMEYCKGDRAFPSDRLPLSAGDDGRQFLSTLMAINPDNRMSTAQCLDHSWMEMQPINVEMELIGLNLGQTNEQRLVQSDTIQDASASWSTVPYTPAEIAFLRALYQKAAARSSNQEGPRQAQIEENLGT
jgi:serine/threonine protein kinase